MARSKAAVVQLCVDRASSTVLSPASLVAVPRRWGVGATGAGGSGSAVARLCARLWAGPDPGDRFQVTSLCPQVAFMTVTLFPVRLLFAAFMMLLAWPLALVASLGSAEEEPTQPPTLWRR